MTLNSATSPRFSPHALVCFFLCSTYLLLSISPHHISNYTRTEEKSLQDSWTFLFENSSFQIPHTYENRLKAVLKLDVCDNKDKRKAMKIVSRFAGVKSVEINLKDQRLVVTRDIDAVEMMRKLKWMCKTDIVPV
ncbi:heavy metal-associated isoprenylated plant protein 41-like [Eucalyptus grandis]|uniref:heavy metal-associated isoprenylated plant protein 41-like n=1 Tax=Eucalyptus grandis TaxID=71139 RepID=UPI00192E7AEF|nr:heavy metal-associated isoprenylated plant protein 41-like [Eucalyptus grandis]